MCGADRNGIRTDAEKPGMAQTDLSREAHEQVQACNCQCKNKDERTDAVVICRRKKPRYANEDRGNHHGRQQPDFEQLAQA